MSPSLSQKPWFLFPAVLLFLLVTSCAINPPVQEMSNARQTIQSAYDVKAQRYAPLELKEAERLLRRAANALDAGDYPSARKYAIAAQQQAIKARQQAIANNKHDSP